MKVAATLCVQQGPAQSGGLSVLFLNTMRGGVMSSHFRKVARRHNQFELVVESLESRYALSTASFIATDLVSDQPGVAPITDPTLVNAWGIAMNPTGSAFWVSSNGSDLSEVYGGGTPMTQPFKVNIPNGAPTGQVYNGSSDFVITDGTNSEPARFIFASEAGTVSGWNPDVGVASGAMPPSVDAEVGFQASDGAIYKGIAMANNGSGNFLYLTDFHNGKIDVLDSQFQPTQMAGSFTDPNLPCGYAPFEVAAINGKLYVSYAKQDADQEDDVAGKGNGFINVFDTNGNFEQRLVSHGDLNSPWGMVQAPAGFGQFGNDLLVGNFGDGRIHAYDATTGQEMGTLARKPGRALVIDGLWGLAFGNGAGAGNANTLYYAAGPDHEAHGLFGKITANPRGTNPVTAVLNGDDLAITGSRDTDFVRVNLEGHGQTVVIAGGHKIGHFPASDVGTIHFSGFAGNDFFSVSPRVTATVIADGGAGSDTLHGGGGSNILLGGTGNDWLRGGRDRDLLIGGDGRDHLRGAQGDDVLTGGSTTYDANDQALLQILAAWNANSSYNNRVAVLRNGTGGVPALDNMTVLDDGVVDDLFGGPGIDFFVGQSPDRFHHRQSNEQTF
jgi:uncharacterized protein (TIGR03118 family)